MIVGPMRCFACLLLATTFLSAARPVSAQVPVPQDTSAVRADTTPPPLGPRAPAPVDTIDRGPSPRSALFRSLLVPGLGQFSVGAHVRGTIYMAIGATSWGMLVKTIRKLDAAEERARAGKVFVIDSLRAAMAVDTALARQLADTAAFWSPAFQEAVESDSLVVQREGLVDARRQQRQDWIAYTLFFTFLNALDAYVAAHLTEFPAELDVERRADGGMELGVRMALPGRRE